eukprot:GDKK01040799.1.p1 GENE.GDKK01040799.1~~GDKK01040799.1.p1  ORF type:complete len:382 (+),score=140.08 GDKK01040799.1:37-1146(+)
MFGCFGCKKVTQETVTKPRPISQSIEPADTPQIASAVKLTEPTEELNISSSTKVESVNDSGLRNSMAYSEEDINDIIPKVQIIAEPMETLEITRVEEPEMKFFTRPVSVANTHHIAQEGDDHDILADEMVDAVFVTAIEQSFDDDEEAFMNVVTTSVNNIFANCYNELENEGVETIKETRPFSASTPPGTIEEEEEEKEKEKVSESLVLVSSEGIEIEKNEAVAEDEALLTIEQNVIETVDETPLSPNAFRRARALRDSMKMSETLSESRPNSATMNLNAVPVSSSVLTQRLGAGAGPSRAAGVSSANSRRGASSLLAASGMSLPSTAAGVVGTGGVSAGAMNAQPTLRKGAMTASMAGLPCVDAFLMN